MEAAGGGGRGRRPRPATTYSLLVGLVFVAVIAVAGVNLLQSEGEGLLDPTEGGELPLAQFAIPDARSNLEGDANIAQDDCESAEIPCPRSDRRRPACRVEVEGAIRVCDLFGRPLVLSFWFTRGGDCEAQQDAFEAAYRRWGERVNFLAIDVRDERDEVLELIEDRGWTHPVGLDPDGALSNLYRIGGCPTFLYVYPGGILKTTSIGELSATQLSNRVRDLVVASRRRVAAGR